MPNSRKGFIVVLILVVVLGLGGGLVMYMRSKKQGMPTGTSANTSSEVTQEWSSPTKAVAGYADADVVMTKDGKYRMYFGDVPTPGGKFTHAIYSALSSDGKVWQMENGVRQSEASFPDVVTLADGSYRMYFQGTRGIHSATSSDGLVWVEDTGTRITATSVAGLKITEVGASTTFRMADGTYVMVYRGTSPTTYDTQAPNKGTNLLLWATSSDGLNFTTKGVAVDSRNATYDGWLDGPDFVQWGNEIRLYYWTYSGVYYSSFDGKVFSGDNLAISATSGDPMKKYAENPPGDPSVIKIKDTWFMYYGSYNNGDQTIYYTTLK